MKTGKLRSLTRVVAVTLLLMSVVGCEEAEEEAEDSLVSVNGVVNGKQLQDADVEFALFENSIVSLHGCTGVLVSDHLVLTAAHCVGWTNRAPLQQLAA